ncbi:MAG: aldo/keto reductase, partial [Alphaproteobacteria bacterium]|nr:aldo/keto reductase [Alphaproteobacteria bacterium]
RREEVAGLRLGLDLGIALIDTAEMYGSGGAEEVVGEAIAGRREELFIVSKVLPQNATRPGTTVAAAERSLRRLGTDRIDLYLLHWPGSHALQETLDGFVALREAGKIVHYGVSNFDTAAMARALALRGGGGIAVNQVKYNLAARGVEETLLPWCAAHDVAVMAYSPLAQARLGVSSGLAAVAARHAVTPEAVAISWTMRHPGISAIPKGVCEAHVRANARAADVVLTPADLATIDRDYPATGTGLAAVGRRIGRAFGRG